MATIFSAAFDRVSGDLGQLQAKLEEALAACRRKHGALEDLDDEGRTTYLTGRRISVPGSGELSNPGLGLPDYGLD